jgi:hypothetical protein
VVEFHIPALVSEIRKPNSDVRRIPTCDRMTPLMTASGASKIITGAFELV